MVKKFQKFISSFSFKRVIALFVVVLVLSLTLIPLFSLIAFAAETPSTYIIKYSFGGPDARDFLDVVGEFGVIDHVSGGKGQVDQVLTLTYPQEPPINSPKGFFCYEFRVYGWHSLNHYSCRVYSSLDSMINGQEPYLTFKLSEEGTYNAYITDGSYIIIDSYNYESFNPLDNVCTIRFYITPYDLTDIYNSGVSAGLSSNASANLGENLLGSTLNAPIDALNGFVLTSTPFGDITLGSVVGSLIALSIFITFLKFFAGG